MVGCLSMCDKEPMRSPMREDQVPIQKAPLDMKTSLEEGSLVWCKIGGGSDNNTKEIIDG